MASVMSSPLMRTTRLRNGSSGFVINENSKSVPSCSGLQYPGAAPCGCQMPTKRLTGLAAVLRKGVWAGTIESSSGKANVTPTPRKNVRRAICFFVINIYLASLVRTLFHFRSHLKWGALDHTHQERRKLIVILFRFPHNRAD